MAGINNWPHAQGLGEWIQHNDKRMLHNERRPIPRQASDLLGPGIAATATEIFDWNTDAVDFNGFYYAPAGSLNSPDPDKFWMGLVMVTASGYGLQQLWEYTGDSGWLPNPSAQMRAFLPTGGTPLFSPWVTHQEEMHHVGDPGQVPFEGTWGNAGVGTGTMYRREGDVVRLMGACAGGTGTIFVLPPGYRPLYFERDVAGILQVDADGSVHLVTDGANTYVSLTGFTFVARQ